MDNQECNNWHGKENLADKHQDMDDTPMIFIVIGEVRQDGQTHMTPFNALLAAPDDDTAVRLVLESLSQEGYAEADLHQIGNLEGKPDDPQFQEAYQSAQNGDVAVIVFDSDSHNGL